MKATLTFNLPDEAWEFECASRGYNVIRDLNYFKEKIHSQLKHGHEYFTVDEVLDYVYSELILISSQVGEF